MALIKLNKNNLIHNLETISNYAGEKDKVAIVLKDNAYGHGLIEIAAMASEFGIKKAVVRTLEEALAIEKLFDYILILAHKDFHTYSHTFHIALNTLDDIDYLPHGCNVHIKVDTGMHRNGISPDELKVAFLGLSKKNIKVTGIFTHYRSADEFSTEFFWQKSVFSRVKLTVSEICEQLKLDIPSFHSCNSAGLFRHTNFDEDFARVGIATYGYLDNANIFKFPSLKPVLSLWGKRLSTRTLKAKQSVGYGGTYKTLEDTVISTYDVGYGDGFLRINERKNYVTPDGFKVLGRVSMDNLSLDTDKDEVCIFNDANQLAKVHDTISYEITTTLSTQIKRVIE